MSDELKLLPCPFCGCADVRTSAPCNDAPDDDIQLNSWQVVCPQCLCAGPSRADYDDMVSFWNNRPDLEAAEQAAWDAAREGEYDWNTYTTIEDWRKGRRCK